MFKWMKSLFVTAEDVAEPANQKLSEITPKPLTPKKIEKVVEVEVDTVKATKASLSKLTKQGLEDFAKANYGVDIDKRKKKEELVKEVLKLSKKA
jgi:hypothetical protein